MAICVVIKPVKIDGTHYDRGDLIDSGALRNEANLISTRYLRAATPEEYAEAVGMTVSFDQEVHGKSKKMQAPVEDEDEDDDGDDDDIEDADDDVEESEDAPVKKAQPRASKKAAKKTAKKTVKKTAKKAPKKT